MNQNIMELVSQMTLEEKASLCSGQDFWHLKGIERLGIPSVMVTDGPHGLRKQAETSDHLGLNESVEAVCFPAACATASGFDQELLSTMGEALGEECRAEDVAVLLGPAVNIKRSPLCGRNFEYFSEDPCLTGKLAAAQIRGIQSWDVGTSIKHFAANNQEYRRMTCSSQLDARTFREIYLPGFETSVKEAQPWTVMCSYNKINGEFASENEMLLTDILRKEWGFEGFVVSDWGAVNDHVKGIAAGMELEMPASGPDTDAKVAEAVKNGTLPEAVLDQAVARILTIIARYANCPHPEAVFDRKKHHALTVEIAKECAVLLKNDGLLPLPSTETIAYIGGYAMHPRFQGGGSSHINASQITSALETGKQKGRKLLYAEGFPADADRTDHDLFASALDTARNADTVVVFAGLPDSFESEGYDRTHMQLPDCQNELIQKIIELGKKVVVVLHNGSPVELPWADKVHAILEMYLGGQGVGEAADALLYGEANPCGRLPETFPLHLEDNPSFLNFPGDGETVNYAEGIYVGYRYYDKKKMPVRFPFGHGLSYTDFSYSNARLSQAKMAEGESVVLSVDVTNTGSCSGKEVVQLYISDLTNAAPRPVKELKDFAKVLLEPGETKTVTFTITDRSLSWYSEKLSDWYAASGQYQLLLAHSSADIRDSVTLDYLAQKHIPLTVTANTPLASVMQDTRTAGFIAEFVAKMFGSVAPASDENSADVIMSPAMMQTVIENAPLRALKSFSGMPDAELQHMISKLNQLLS